MGANSFKLRPDLLEEICWYELASGEMVAKTDEEHGALIARDMAPAVKIEFRRPIRTVVRQDWYVIFGGIPVGETQPLAFLADGTHQISIPRNGLFAYVLERMYLMLKQPFSTYPVILPTAIGEPAPKRILSSHSLLYRERTSTAYLVLTDFAFTYLLERNQKHVDDVEF
ncbi:MAG: hypothetical protein Q8J74_14545 [Candidatus Didemnitutus sp.]|nr:hypothetical protein [Candidatus Didemnitutus sp.]